MPSDLHQTAATQTDISFLWSSGATDSGKRYSYVYEISKSKSFLQSDLVYENSVDSCTDGNAENTLTAGQDYYVRVGMIDNTDGAITDKTACRWAAPVKMSTAPAVTKGWKVKQTNVSASSLTLSWTKLKNASGYEVRYQQMGALGVKKKYVTGTSVSLTGLDADAGYRIAVAPYRRSGAYLAVSSTGAESSFYTLSKVSDFSLDITNLGSYDFSWEQLFGAAGYEIRITDYKDTKFSKKPVYQKKLSADSLSVAAKKLSKGKFYLAGIRSYMKLSNGQTKYSGWTTLICGTASKKVTARRSGSTIKINWTKVTGATGYNIYVSNSAASGYRKVTTVNAKTTKYVLKKLQNKKLNQKKNYFIRIEPVRKEKNKTVCTFASGICSYDAAVRKK